MTDEPAPPETHAKPPKLTFRDYVKKLIADGLPIPVPLQMAYGGKGMAVRIGACDEWIGWAAAHGYSVAQAMTLRLALGRLCRSQVYLKALAAPSSTRHAVDGTVVEEASSQDREHAAKGLAKRAAKAAAKQASGVPKPPFPAPRPAPTPAPPEPPPIVVKQAMPIFRDNNAQLSPEQIAARRAALRASLLTPKKAATS